MNKRLLCVLLCVCLLTFGMPVYAVETETVTITTAEEFLAFSENCRLDSYSQGLTVLLQADLDLSGVEFMGVPVFRGTFEGNGHTIRGLRITGGGSDRGLFRYLMETAVVRDLTMEGEVSPGGSRSTVGGLAGSNAGLIENCVFRGDVSGGNGVGGLVGTNAVTGILDSCRTEGSVHGDHFVGGLAGENLGVIRNCANAAQVNTTAVQNSVEISDITVESLTGSEAANTATDIGGIAGTSSGVIRNSENRGNVGYRHMGYNIGGIAGSQSGYIADCVNYGDISGRKEVGGIVGQMEPVTRVDFSKDTLQQLQEQLGTLSGLVDQTTGSIQGGASYVGGQIGALRDHAQNASDAVDQLIPDREDPSLPDIDTIVAVQNTLSTSIGAIPGTVDSIISGLGSTASAISRDMQAIGEQMHAIGQTLDGVSENLGGSITDASDLDTDEDVTGKIAQCTNLGAVLGDLNVGGIAGAMSFENDLDPENDMQLYGENSLNFEGQLRAVIRSCENRGTVTARKQNVGGIAGWQFLGLVKECVNSGAVEGEAAAYVGGIVGRSTGYIRRCGAKALLSGDSYVGGIAGSALVVSDCRSMVRLTGGEKLGAVIGFPEEEHSRNETQILGNFYLNVDTDIGGMDGISYTGSAEPLELEAFLSLEALPELFGTVTLTFHQDNGESEYVTVRTGGALDVSKIPAIPEKTGYMGSWEGLDSFDLSQVHFSAEFRAVYRANSAVLRSEEVRDDGLPVLLVQGSFADGAGVTVRRYESYPPLTDRQVLIEAWRFAVTGDTSARAARFCLPENCDTDAMELLLGKADGSWETAKYTIEGSYLVFDLSDGVESFAIVGVQPLPWPWLAATGAALVLAAALVFVGISRRRAKPRTETAVTDETDAAGLS